MGNLIYKNEFTHSTLIYNIKLDATVFLWNISFVARSDFAKGGNTTLKIHNPEKQTTWGIKRMRQESGQQVSWEERVQAFKTVIFQTVIRRAKRFSSDSWGLCYVLRYCFYRDIQAITFTIRWCIGLHWYEVCLSSFLPKRNKLKEKPQNHSFFYVYFLCPSFLFFPFFLGGVDNN